MDRNPHKIMAARVLSLDDLPDSVIEKISTHLPIRDAAKTSILSKKWKNHWRNIPALVFDDSFSAAESLEMDKQIYSLLDLSQILLNHRGPIHKFTLSFRLDRCPQIDNIMLFLCDKDVHEFTFDLFECHKMPSYLFAYHQLRHLNLANCEFRAPLPLFEGFPHLLSLRFSVIDFSSVECNNSFISTLISKCPLLELLSIDDECTGISRLEIDAPKLKSLYIFGSVESFFLNNTPLLSSVKIEYFDEFGNDGEGLTSKLIRFFECLPVVEYLRIENFDFKPEVKLLTSLRIPIAFNHLKVLEVDCNVYRELHLSLVLALIINSPNLEKLILEVRPAVPDAKGSDSLKLFELENLSDVTFQKLQDSEMTNFFGTSVELELVKFMLLKSLVLETLTLSVNRRVGNRYTCEQISKAVAKFVRASPKLTIIIL